MIEWKEIERVRWPEPVVAGIIDLGNRQGFDLQLIRNPGGLSPLEQEVLVKQLNEISVEAFNKPTPLEETRERTVCVDAILLIKEPDTAGRVVGYTTNDMMRLAGENVNYFSSALFRRSIQNEGLYTLVNDLRAEFMPTDVIMTRTQNPVVMHSFHELCARRGFQFFPNGIPPTDKVLEIARGYAPQATDDLICRQVYGRALMDSTPRPKGEEAVKLFSKLDIDKGDAVILIGIKEQQVNCPNWGGGYCPFPLN